MTTPESDPYADHGESDWQVRPAVPGWSVGQDFLTGPIFDDTGWHIDLSNVDWAGSGVDRNRAEDPREDDGYGPPATAPRYYRRDSAARNGDAAYAGPRSPGEPAWTPGPGRRAWPEPPAPDRSKGNSAWPEPAAPERAERRPGRRGRHHRSDDELAQRPARGPGPSSQPRPAEPLRTPSRRPPEWRDGPGYQPPGRDTPGYQPPGGDTPGYQGDGYDSRGYQPPGSGTPGHRPDSYDGRGYERPGSGTTGYERPGHDAAADYAAPAGYDGRSGAGQTGYAPPGYERSGYAQPGYAEPGYAEPGYEPPQPRPSPPPGAAQPGYAEPGYQRTRPGTTGYERPGRDAAADYATPGGYDGRSGGGQTGYAPPGYEQAGYAQPGYAEPGYAEPGYAQPGYAQPGYAQPGYAEPGYAEPGYEPPPARPGPPPGAAPPGTGSPRVAGTRPAGMRPGVRPSEVFGEPRTSEPRTGEPWAGEPRAAGPGLAGPRAPAEAPPDRGSASIVRSSGVMAVGTLGSRLTGFLRQIAQSVAFGAAGIAAAYNLSNTLPNVVYNLALGGILTSVIVPLIVNAAKRDSGRSSGYDQRMFTLVTATLAGVTLVAMAAAAPIVHLYAGSKIADSPQTVHLAIIFALFFIPQIFFYGVSSLIGAILNSRGSFAAPMWTPMVNNFVVIFVLGLYVAVAGLHKTPGTISSFEIELLGLGTTLGIVAQTVALVPALRRVGFRWHPRTDFRRGEIAEIGRMAGWMFGYIGATQVAFLVTTKVAGDASLAGITEYNYAWLLFQLPYAVVGISVITALLPRMSAHAADRRYGLVRQDFSTGVRLAAAIVVPCSLVLAVLGPKLGEVFLNPFGYGAMSPADARYTGVVFAVFCLGLLPYMIFQLQLRVFYSLHDSRTPALIGLVTMTVNIVANVIALKVLRDNVVAGLGVGFGLANVVGMVVAWRILTRRLRGLDGYLIGRSLVRMHAAALPAALIAVLVGIITGNAVIDLLVGGGLAVAMYLLFARALRIEEVTGLSRMVMSRLGR